MSYDLLVETDRTIQQLVETAALLNQRFVRVKQIAWKSAWFTIIEVFPIQFVANLWRFSTR
jgi:hypothetical protein